MNMRHINTEIIGGSMLPTPIKIENGYRIFCSKRTEDNISTMYSVDVDNEFNLSGVNSECMCPGPIGRFDEHGVSPSFAYWDGNVMCMMYIGWQRYYSFPYTLISGFATSTDKGITWKKQQNQMLPALLTQRFVRSAPMALIHKQEAWYIGGDEWITDYRNKLVPSYDVYYMKDQLSVKCSGLRAEDSYGIGRPWVIDMDGFYRMLFSDRTKSNGYNIYYADSRDGVNWIRNYVPLIDRFGTTANEMVCFTAYIDGWLVFNGNGYGKTGIFACQYNLKDLPILI